MENVWTVWEAEAAPTFLPGQSSKSGAQCQPGAAEEIQVDSAKPATVSSEKPGDWIGRIDSNRHVVPLQMNELSRAWRSLREKYQISLGPRHWRRRPQVQESITESRPEAALFHIDRALERLPQDPDLLQERATLVNALADRKTTAFGPGKVSRRIPTRPPWSTSDQIDLSTAYNLALNDSLSQRLDGKDSHELPLGLNSFGVVRFDVRGIVHLSGQAIRNSGQVYPESIPGIRVVRKCRRFVSSMDRAAAFLVALSVE